MSVVFFGEILEGFFDMPLVIQIIQFAVRLAPELFPLLVIVGKGIATSSARIGSPISLPVPILIFIVPWTVFSHYV
jgi:hypothetical protein